MTSTQIAVSLLRPHPANQSIYNDTADEDFIADIRKNGIEHPLLITQDNRIISGHRRWTAARAIGLATVPARVFASTDELDIIEKLVLSNRNRRERTNEQKAREAQALMRVESERAKRRQQQSGETHGRGKVVEPFPQPIPEDAGKARDRVGEAIGVSGKTAEALVLVADTIDELTNSGETGKAEVLRAALTKGAKPAAAEARKMSSQRSTAKEGSIRRFFGRAESKSASPALKKAIDAILLARKKIDEAARAILTVFDGPMAPIFARYLGELRVSARSTSASAKLNYFTKIDKFLFDLIPVSDTCPFCDLDTDKTCVACSGSHLITKGVYQSLAQEMQSQVKLLAD